MNDNHKDEQLINRVKRLEQEVELLKTAILQGEKTENQEVEKIATPVNISADIPPKTKPVVKEPIKTPKKEVDLERVIGQIWLPRVFILVLILGILWGYKAMVDVGLITEHVQLLLGFAASFFLIHLGKKQLIKSRETLGQVLLGGSIVILILTTFSGDVLYNIIPPFLAFLMNVAWVVLGIHLSNKHHSQPIAILSSIAGFLTPFLVEGMVASDYILVGYEVLFFIALLHFSLLKKYLRLYYTSAALLHLSLWIASSMEIVDEELALMGIIIQHLFLLGAFIKRELYFNQQKGTLLTSFVLTQIWVNSISSEFNYTLFLGLSFVIYLGITYLYRNSEKLHATLPIATYSLAMLLVDVLNYDELGPIFVIQGLISLYVGFATKGTIQRFLGTGLYFLGASFTVFEPISKVVSFETIAWLILIASVIALREILIKYKSSYEKILDFKSIMNLLFASGAILILIFITQEGLAATSSLSHNVQSLTVSSLWAIYSIIGVIYGVTKDKKRIRILGIVLLFLTLLKLIFIDMSSVSIIVRAVLFIGLGGIGVFLSRFFYKGE